MATLKLPDSLIPHIRDEELQKKLHDICTSAYSSFKLMEPWHTAQSEIVQFSQVILDIKAQGELYYNAIDNSIRSSESGYSISVECERLCTSLTNGVSVEQLRYNIGVIRSMADSAHSDALRICELFRSVRQGLDQATRAFLQVAEDLEFDHAPLDCAVIMVDELSIGESGYHRDRAEKPRSDSEAQVHLKNVSKRLEQLVEHVGAFASWWLDLDSKFCSAETHISHLRPEKIVRLTVKSATKEWARIKDTYLEYKTSIAKLQDYFPRSRHLPQDVDRVADQAETTRQDLVVVIQEREDAMLALQIASSQNAELEALSKAACRSFKLIEPWDNATSVHPDIQPLIHRIQEQGVAYYHALDTSIEVVQSGYTFCSDSEDLCDYIVDSDCTTAELQEFIATMQDNANQAVDRASRVVRIFRTVRQDLYRIMVDIRSSRETNRVTARVATLQQKESEQACEDISGYISTARFLFLPAALPIFDGLFSAVEGGLTKNYKAKIEERKEEIRSLDDVLQVLDRAVADIDSLASLVDIFTGWWLCMVSMLQTLENGVDRVRATNTLTTQITTVKRNWGVAKANYQNYKEKMCRLQDLTPASRQTGPARILQV